MVALPQLSDPTLEAADRAMEAISREQREVRPYLGASAIGKPCERQLWYDFRNAGREAMTAASLKRIEDGHHGEDVQAVRLRLVSGIELHTIDPETGRQIGIEDHAGHFRGHLDGAICGLLQSPKTWHVWEHKQVGEDKLTKLQKLKVSLGEKNALHEWDIVYWSQAQIYMHYTGMTRHYLTAASPGGRNTVSCRTDYDAEAAIRLVEKARRVIFSEEPPVRASENADFYLCRFCPHSAYCHGSALPMRNCRTCLFSTPNPEGGWGCEKHKRGIDPAQFLDGCPDQRFIPAIVPFQQEDAADDASWIAYRTDSMGGTWVDEGHGHD